MNFKSILACAALLIGIGTATAAVESDVVGYQTIKTTAGKYAMIGCMFEGLTGNTLTDILKPTNPASFSAGDIVMIHTGSGYDTYEYKAGGRGDTEVTWRTSGGTKSEPTIEPGTAFWVKTTADMELLTSGAVLAEESTIETVANQYKMASFSYPVDYVLNDLPIENLSTGDFVMIHNGDGYDTYEYKAGGRGDSVVSWRTSGGTKTDVEIPAGKAFWLKTAKTVTITVDSPIK